jgi:CRP/FNR family cyclic AMP-dependent transcriptional regulator
MPSLLSLMSSQPLRTLAAGDQLIAEGGASGDLYVLESGSLAVTRQGVEIATITQAGAVVGEMSLLLDRPHSATVRAQAPTRVRVLADARRVLDTNPVLTKGLAALLAARLDATSALIVELSRQHPGKAETSFFDRILDVLHLPAIDADYFPVERHDLFDGGDEK